MGGDIDWSALPLMAAMHDVEDLESLAHWLATIRNELTPKPKNGRSEN